MLSREYQEGLLLLQQQRFQPAYQRFQIASQGSTEPEVWFALGVSAYRLHILPEAYRAFETGLSLLPSPKLGAQLRGGLGDVLFDMGNYQEALTYYQQALDFQPGWLGLRLKRAATYLRLQRYEDALAETEALLQMQFPPAETRYLRALIYLGQQNWKQALPELQALQAYPAHRFEALQDLNWLYRTQGLRQEAVQSAEALLVLGSDYPQAYRLATLTYLEQLYLCLPEANCKALRSLTYRALERWQLSDVYHPEAFAVFGQLQQLEQNWGAAEQAYQQASQYFPQSLTYALKQAEMVRAQGKPIASAGGMKQHSPETERQIWQELGKWPSLAQDYLDNAESKNSSTRLFWQALLQTNWKHPAEFTAKALKSLETPLNSPEQKMEQAFRLWSAGEKSWAIRLVKSARTMAPDWWLPYEVLGYLYREQPIESFKWLKIAYLLNPISQELLHSLLQVSPAGTERQDLLLRGLKTFPNDSQLQNWYLESLK